MLHVGASKQPRPRFGDAFAGALAPSNLSLMDQVTPPDRRDYSPVMVEEFGYDREAVAFLGISRLKGVGFQTLFGIGGRSGIADLLETHNVTEVARRISVVPNAPAKSWDWDELSRRIF